MDVLPVDGRAGNSPAAAVANMVVGLFSEYTGRGPTRARAYLHDDIVTVVLKETLTKAERSLHDRGRSQQVLDMRLAFQQTMRDDLVHGIEKILDRKVHAFLSANHLDPDIAIETFVLEPRHDSQRDGS
jgi:uncharacterized protein YbcI